MIFASCLAADVTFDNSRDFDEERDAPDLRPPNKDLSLLKEWSFLETTFVFTARGVFELTGIWLRYILSDTRKSCNFRLQLHY